MSRSCLRTVITPDLESDVSGITPEVTSYFAPDLKSGLPEVTPVTHVLPRNTLEVVGNIRYELKRQQTRKNTPLFEERLDLRVLKPADIDFW